VCAVAFWAQVNTWAQRYYVIGNEQHLISKLEQFHRGQEDWESYEEHLQQYFIVNNIKEAKNKRAILLSACRQNTYKVVHNPVAPQKPGELTINTI